jgi:hypothetical protein
LSWIREIDTYDQAFHEQVVAAAAVVVVVVKQQERCDRVALCRPAHVIVFKLRLPN